MKVTVKSIIPLSQDNNIKRFLAIILLNDEEHKFNLDVETYCIDKQPIQGFVPDLPFTEIFKHDIGLHSAVCRLVFTVYNEEPVKFPCFIGELEPEKQINYSVLKN
ncbi:MAG: hypothetical protein N5P05_004676 (plasmid) [Chroococcopsis gigantea SAG 12.99]|jgi:hypothetical protein|nr:hypothetical protein [Chroococcopsis gigantea SAG 12.99]